MTPRARPPLFRRPGAVVLLDDDADYLEMLAMVLPRHWPLRLFTRPTQCVHAMHRELRLWEADLWQVQYAVDLWRQGKPLLPQVLGYWARATERFSLTQVCVVDFSMPAMDGLQVLSELVDWPGARVMLTGQADERVAVDAFNRGLIDQYIPKQVAEMATLLAKSLRRLADPFHDRHDAIWRATLRPQQMALFRQGGAGPALKALMEREWVDHVVMGDPFGVLGLDLDGRATWLQLVPREQLAAHAQAAAAEGLAGEVLQAVREGRAMVCTQVRGHLGLHGHGPVVPTFALDSEGLLLAARFALEPTDLPEPIEGYRSWLAARGPRCIQDERPSGW